MKTQKRRFLMDLVYRALSFYALTFLLWSCQEEISGNPDPHLLAQN
jgi:hypothetical protein